MKQKPTYASVSHLDWEADIHNCDAGTIYYYISYSLT